MSKTKDMYKYRMRNSPRKTILNRSKINEIFSRVVLYSGNSEVVNLKSMDEFETISQSSSCILNSIESDYVLYVDNITDLPFTDTDKVIRFILKRYLNRDIYTWAGQTLLAIHPYQTMRATYKDDMSVEKPSIRAVVSRAWFRLQENLGKANQMILISGETGAGKSFSACMAIKHIASIGENIGDAVTETVLWHVWSLFPLLTAFGHAPTKHNTTSSRFGKMLQLQIAHGTIRGAYIQTYLLEKSRVPGPNNGEGNFHIFRQVLDSLDMETLSGLCLEKSVCYKIAPSTEVHTSAYTQTVKALETLNIHGDLDNILIILAVILNMGNIEFELSHDEYVVTSDSMIYVENASCLLKARPWNLCQLLCTVQFCAKYKRHTIHTSPCANKECCEARRDCMMKFLYEKLFLWLVDAINIRIYSEHEQYQLLGLIDVYGFEMFDNNYFEQLCINYANERLQYYFMKMYISDQQNDLISEGFHVEDIDISIYSKRIALLDGPISVFGILNEECAVKRFNNDIFINTRLTESLKHSEYFIGSGHELNTYFSIRHFAGVVKYDTKSMVHKNRDKVPDDMINFLKNCNNTFVSQLFDYNGTEDNCHGVATLMTKFKKSLDNLLITLDKADVHYIKCLKPNPMQESRFFDEKYFEQQLISNGVLEIMKLQLQKFSIRLDFQDFILVFTNKTFNLLQEVLKNEMHVGKKRIYLTEKAYITFQRMKRIRLSIQARKIQFYWYRFRNTKHVAAIKIQKFFRRFNFQHKGAIYEKFIDLSKKSSEISFFKQDDLADIYKIPAAVRTAQYLKTQQFQSHGEGAPLSLFLEKAYLELRTEKFKRVLFFGDRIVSFNKLAEVPVRLHTSKTCIKYSYLLPKSECPKGLLDIF